MKPEEQLIAIAEACPRLFRIMKESRDLCWVPPGMTYEQDVDPLSDLNAMHEAVLTQRDRLGGYCMELRRIVRRDTPDEYDVYGDINYYHATAAQRCEAFLRTLNLWKE